MPEDYSGSANLLREQLLPVVDIEEPAVAERVEAGPREVCVAVRVRQRVVRRPQRRFRLQESVCEYIGSMEKLNKAMN